MAVTMTEQFRELYASGNKMRIGYKCEFTGTYPASGGYIINNSVLPDAEQDFSKIYAVIWNFFQYDAENGVVYMVDYDTLDNSDDTDPTFEISAYEEATGGGLNEVTAGAAFTGTCYIIVEGVPVGGIDSSSQI